MIKQLKLTNWKSFGEATLYVDPLTILIGTNASGKSNILDALIFLRNVAKGERISAILAGDGSIGKGVRGGNEWAIRQGEDRARLELVIGHFEEEHIEFRYEIELELLGGLSIEIAGEHLTRIQTGGEAGGVREQSLFYTDENDPDQQRVDYITVYFMQEEGTDKPLTLRRSHSVLSQVKSLLLADQVTEAILELTAKLSGIFVFDPVPGLIRSFSKVSDELQASGANTAGVLAAISESGKYKHGIEDTLVRCLRRLPEQEITRVWSERVGRFKTDAMLYCEESWSENKKVIVDARGMSDGTLRLIAIMTALLTLPPHSLLVVEEIDNGMHPSRASLLVEFLREIGPERKIDIICTTHNPALLDAFGNEMIPFISLVYREDGSGNSAIKLLEDLDHLPRLMARGKVGKLVTEGLLEKAVHK